MSQSATLQRVQAVDFYGRLEEEVRNHSHGTALLFLYCAGNSSDTEAGQTEVQSFVDQLSGVNGEVLLDTNTGVLAVTLPGYSLDAAHYQALLLKQHLQGRLEQADPRITLAALTEVPSALTLKQMAEATKLSTSSDIHIFTQEEVDSGQNRILIVDQDATVREFLQIRLTMQGYETLEAVDGLEALDLIPKWEPDLVLTELNLHGIDGLPFIHHIQQLDMKEPPKIVVLTEKRVEQTISQCFQNGVDDYVTKPFSPVELDARIRRCLH
ncbi:response regulator transcription factor [Paenibacillus lautus]|uniref:response regulator transcription factor n=1 Tax=Paenibacillus lautus TaxID=1401 RepID=UPI002DBDF0EE|nr:response regulator transcription factor [Paenibacillus lautus]MEC0306457.1 response regulator transcription factor [Paenibacillus lautus]